jgi:hypothetical protein
MRYVSRVFLVLIAIIAAAGAARAGDPVLALLDPYFRIQTQLTSDSTEGIKSDAELIAKGAHELGDAGKGIATAADTLGTTSSLPEAREAFSKLSDAVIAYADGVKANTGSDVNTMYCPMVKKSWMQKGDKVRNPYGGKAMLDCGEKKKKNS